MYSMENNAMRVRVAGLGAELTSAVHKRSGREMLWQGETEVWRRHAPLLFPYCGRLQNHRMVVRGREYPAPIHGFAQEMPFVCTAHGDDSVEFTLRSDAATRAMFPYEFVLAVEYRLRGNVLRQSVKVENPGQPQGGALPFTVGFHPGFALPPEESGQWEIAFEKPESPYVVETPGGYVSGRRHLLFEGKRVLPLEEDLFAQDSLCLQGLRSGYVTLRPTEQAGPPRGVRVKVEGFANVLLWGPAEGPLELVCIEPWHGLPDGQEAYGEFEDKPNMVHLPQGGEWQTSLEMTFLG